jgi:hypothetical protein
MLVPAVSLYDDAVVSFFTEQLSSTAQQTRRGAGEQESSCSNVDLGCTAAYFGSSMTLFALVQCLEQHCPCKTSNTTVQLLAHS